MFDGLDGCTHLWLLFWFHRQTQNWSPKVRPPRLGGNVKRGVFATRSPFRPSPIGLSAVELLKVEGYRLLLGGVDLLDGTPILDIKPYVPYSDCLPQAKPAFAETPPEPLVVEFSREAEVRLAHRPALRTLVEETLGQDPRPAYQRDDREYGTRLEQVNVRWRVCENRVEVLSVEDVMLT